MMTACDSMSSSSSHSLKGGCCEFDFGGDHPESGLRAEALRLLLHPHHQFRAVNSFREAGIIFDDAGARKQSTRQRAGEQHADSNSPAPRTTPRSNPRSQNR